MSEEIATAAADLAAMQQLRTQIAALESQLDQAHEHIARLEAALRDEADEAEYHAATGGRERNHHGNTTL